MRLSKRIGNRSVDTVFQNVAKKAYDTAQQRLTEQLPEIMDWARLYAEEEQRNGKFSDMTGNWINSFGVALYRDGRCVAVANMSNVEGNPIRTTLINDEVFKKGERRFDGSTQQEDFVVGYDPRKMGSSSNYFANEEVLAWLSRSRTTRKGFSYRIISVIEYHKREARQALLRLSDEMESRGGNIWQFHM